jgi:hypothetical protein
VRQAVDEPCLRHVLHPGAYQRDSLAGDEQSEIAVPQSPERLFETARQSWRRYTRGRLQVGLAREFLKNQRRWRIAVFRGRRGHPSSQDSAVQWNSKSSDAAAGGAVLCEATQGAAKQSETGDKRLAEDKLYKAEYLGSGTFIISKPGRKRTKRRQTQLRNPRRGSRK